ncbi:unnamed protein product [Linum tenue]|uniref:HMA domain-containing protein n=1 Tax=Linum tenue TaxID=586396 RepID=A0AAV0IHZ3_9ROSI|nr:unnamed protein product [Linum tenue]
MSPKAEEKVITVKKVDELKLSTAVYRLNLHCKECAITVKRPLLARQGTYVFPGVHSVIADVEKGELKVKGEIDVKEIHEVIRRISKRKVEIVTSETDRKTGNAGKKEIWKTIIRTTSIKVHLHCHKCQIDLKKKLLKHKGIHTVKMDMKAQTVTIQGTIESEKLLSYMRRRVHKHAEIIVSKKVEKKKVEAKCCDDDEKDVVKIKVDKCCDSDQEIITTKPGTRCETETVCVENKDGGLVGAPYFIHYVYAPQLFSDENPNACLIM